LICSITILGRNHANQNQKYDKKPNSLFAWNVHWGNLRFSRCKPCRRLNPWIAIRCKSIARWIFEKEIFISYIETGGRIMMLTILQTVNVLAFTYMAYMLAGVLAQSLRDSELLKPIAMTICSITIALHLHQTDAWMYIVGAFAGYFIHTCVSGYTKKIKAPTNKKRKKVININP
jgi:hypothetical protein